MVMHPASLLRSYFSELSDVPLFDLNEKKLQHK